MIKNRIDIISMGCSKNLVDSERLMKRLQAKGYTLSHDAENPEGEYVVVNTCGFIGDAKEESIQLILDLALLKEEGRIGKIVVMGCLSERYRKELTQEIPEIDRLYGKFDWNTFISDLPDLKVKDREEPKTWERILTTAPHYTYLKVSEGCNRFCAFCAIPLITGRHTSRPIEEILEEVSDLVSKGVKEFNVIAQDLSSYGTDLYGVHKLAELIERMAQMPGVEMIRLHYAYPSDFPYDLLPVMAKYDNVCKYMDIALQHINDGVLQNMRRHITGAETRELLARMRREVPGLKIRTTLMVGFPGETDEAFEELLDFVREQKFDRMGAFAYCEEEGTWGARNLEDTIPQEVKLKRLDRLMAVQEQIAEELNEKMIGKTVRVIIDRIERKSNLAIGRTQWDSPEVDQEVYVYDIPEDIASGDIVEATIDKIEGFDLMASYAG